MKQLEADLRRVIRESVNLSGREFIALQLLRYEKLLRAVWDAALEGDLNAHDRARLTLGEENRLLGIDRTVIEVDSTSDVGKWLAEMLSAAEESESDDIEDE
ncbi:MAG: hypothetical protein LC778_10325 [Acidobacteria bacterium]|nr:hypothetical protein [Acidobacteriota bacterium]